MEKYFTLQIFVKNSKCPPATEQMLQDNSSIYDYNSFKNINYEPSLETVKKILNFSKSYQVFKTKSTGKVETNMN